MSGDGPTKASVAPPEVEPLDEIILGDEEGAPPPPPVAPKAAPPTQGSVRPPAQASPSLEAEAKNADVKDTKKRQKMTLRIPDDEVARPVSSAPAAAARPARPGSVPDDGLTPLMGTPIVSIGVASDTVEVAAALPMPGVDTTNERGWTPYQPPVTESNGGAAGAAKRPPSASSEEIPIVTDEVEEVVVPDDPTVPRLPVSFDSEEIKIEEGERTTDPGEALEVDPEDLVSVESIPSPGAKAARAAKAEAAQHAPPKPAAGVTATALMAGAPTAPAAPVAPTAAVAPAVVKPATPSSPPGARPQPAQPVASATAAQQAGSIVFVPSAGGLAPPPMSDTAASRKKIRPWWEELFNDDYIRTMAKLTDAQIAGEVTFIEDSLGCEAGAMILDLACGTGRHAVQLATRGYQVVGYDLSLSMLARASDEAQERGQKINFVQGDMRDMTFDETFDGIYAWNTSFGFFDEEKNSAVVAKVHRALKKGGQFLLDVVNRDYIVRQAPSLAWFEGDGCICMDEMQIDFITSRMKVKRTLMMDDGRTKEIEYSIRLYSLHELGKLLHDNGFRVAEVSGRTGTPGVFFGCESPRTLILAEKR